MSWTRACSTGACPRSPIRARCASRAGSAPSRVWSAMRQEIYHQRIPIDDALRRIEGLYKPYHRALRRLLTRVHRDFGSAVLIDCHSMPSMVGSKDDRPRADIVLGDRYGTSCVPIVAEVIDATFREFGSVSRNKPYAGGFVAEHRQPGRRAAFDPDRDQSRAVHGRAALWADPSFARLAAGRSSAPRWRSRTRSSARASTRSTAADRAAEAAMRRLIQSDVPASRHHRRGIRSAAKRSRICLGARSDRRHQKLYRRHAGVGEPHRASAQWVSGLWHDGSTLHPGVFHRRWEGRGMARSWLRSSDDRTASSPPGA